MITRLDYESYFGATAPNNLKRLEYLAIQELRSVMTVNVPTSDELTYNDFKKAVMEEINYLNINSDLLDSSSAGGYSLGSYHEGSSSQNDNSKSINRISPIAYDILLNAGLLYSGLGGC